MSTNPVVANQSGKVGQNAMPDPKGENEIHYERGTRGLDSPKNTSTSISAQMHGRTETIRAYKAPEDRSDVPTHRMRGRTWQKMRRRRAEPPSEIEIAARSYEEIEEDEKAEQKRLTCPFPLVFRALEQGDFNFVLNAWLLSNRENMRGVENNEYFRGQQNLIAEIAKRGRRIIIGCDGDTPDWIGGFICGTHLEDGRLLVDYVYVKQTYRRRGIARGLLSALGHTQDQKIVATHKSHSLMHIMSRYNACYNPYFNVIGFADV